MARRRIGQEELRIGGTLRRTSSLDEIAGLVDWAEIDGHLKPIYASERGEQAWPPLAMMKALLLSIWYDLSDIKLAEALDDLASFRRFCGFASDEPRRSAPPSFASGGNSWPGCWIGFCSRP